MNIPTWLRDLLMMAVLIMLVGLFAYSTAVNSSELEIGLGATSFGEKNDGYWYQEKLPTTKSDVTAGFLLGYKFDFSDKFSMHAGYRNLGRYESQSEAVSDQNYLDWQQGEACLQDETTFQTRGRVDGIYAVADYRPWKPFSLKFGGWVYRMRQDVTVTRVLNQPIRREGWNYRETEFGFIYGAGWNIDESTQLSVEVLKINAEGPIQPIYSGRAPISLTLSRSF